MKINKHIPFALMLFLSCITNAHAACTQEEIDNFKKIEDDYTVKYEFNKTTKLYDIYLKSSQAKKYYYNIYVDFELNCTIQDQYTMKCINFPSETYEFTVVGQTDTCNDQLKSIILKLPKYNKLSEDPLCEGIEEFVLCNPTYDKEIDYDTFVSRVETYKRTKAKDKTETNVDEKNNDFLDKSLSYIKENLFSIIIIIIFIVLVIITIIMTAKSMRKSRRLE